MRRGSQCRLEPVGLVHAKRVGTIVTACGLVATSWTKFLGMSFTSVLPRDCVLCAPCLEVVTSQLLASRVAVSAPGGPPQ